jgi:predicted ABC-type ATPase
LERIEGASEARTDFAFETTLSGRSYVRVIRKLRAVGYRIHMFYLWIPGPDLALLRIRNRVQAGGHDVPARDVRRRYDRTLVNLFRLYRPLLDTLRVFDNSTNAPRLIFEDEAGRIVVYDVPVYEQLLHKVNQ